eukprot:11885001-Alexandrium_andersonii.AAC.2
MLGFCKVWVGAWVGQSQAVLVADRSGLCGHLGRSPAAPPQTQFTWNKKRRAPPLSITACGVGMVLRSRWASPAKTRGQTLQVSGRSGRWRLWQSDG